MRRKRLGSALFALLVCLIVIVGFARGWFRLSSSEDSLRNELNVNLTLDRGKFQGDAERAVDKTQNAASQLSDSIKRGASRLGDRAGEKAAPAHP